MTMQYAVLPARSGRSYTGKLFTVAAPDTEVTGNTITVTERTNAKGMFRASIDRTTALPAGDYILVLLQGTIGAAVGYFTFAGTDGETATETPATAALDPAVGAQITGIKTKTDNLPSDPADQSLIIDATNAVMARLGAPAGASISADIAGISVGAGGGDWSDTEKAQIRYRLGLDGTATAPDDPDGEPIVVEPGSGNFTTGYVTCFDQDGQVLPNCKLYQRMIEVPASDVGYAYDASQTSVTSSSVGVAQFPRLVKGGTYLFFRGLEREGTVVTIPTSAGSTYALPSVIGR